jgi:thiamine biosynthesis lipoprotein
MRHLIYGIGFLLFLSCQDSPPTTIADAMSYQKIAGTTMGVVSYHITYNDTLDHQLAIDSLMSDINKEVSTYIPTSAISRFNQSETGILLNDEQHFIKNVEMAELAYRRTQEHFDPTVMPLVNYWGFGYASKEKVEQVEKERIDELLQLVGMNKVQLQDNKLSKTDPGVQLDFSASAKGYFVDQVALFLDEKGVNDYMVEIGGEVRTKGKNDKGEWWKLGVNTPSEGATVEELFALIPIENESIATSGNYRNYYTVEGITYSHTISPVTGMPERSQLLSATIVTQECTYADAYATACMVMGMDAAIEWVASMPNVEAFFIYTDEQNNMQTIMTAGLEGRVQLF